MSKLPAVTGREAIKAFGKIGFEEVRQKGSHVVLKRDGHPLLLTIPDHGNKSLKKGLLRGQIANAGITEDEFIELL